MNIQTIPLQSIQPSRGNPRRAFDPALIEGLAASIRQDGLLQNLVVTKSKGRSFRIISGERRFRTLKLLEERGEIAGTTKSQSKSAASSPRTTRCALPPSKTCSARTCRPSMRRRGVRSAGPQGQQP
jgi:hypothetical protein